MRVGDWEGDLIVGRNNHSAIATLVDRASRYLRLVHLPVRRTAEAVRDALLGTLHELPAAVPLAQIQQVFGGRPHQRVSGHPDG